MKKLFGIILLILSISISQAQILPKYFIGISGGFSNPAGNFKKSEYTDPKSGFAKNGTTLNIEGAVYLGKYFGLGGFISYNVFGVNTKSLADGYREDFAVDESTVTAKKYASVNFLAGPYFSIPINKVTIDFRGLIGVASVTSPEIKVALEDQSVFLQNRKSAAAFAYQLGAGLRYSIFGNFGVSARVDYFASKPNYDITYTNYNNNSGRKIDDYKESVSGINGTIGVFYQMGNEK